MIRPAPPWPRPRGPRPALFAGLLLPVALLVLRSPPAVAEPAEVEEVPPIRLPQMRIDRIDTSHFPKVRVLATVLDARGRSVQVKAFKSLVVRDGSKHSRKPYVEFKKGVALGARKDAVMWPADKAKIKHSAVIVVVGHQEEALRSGTLGARLKESVQRLLKSFGKTDRVNVIFYGDRLYTFVQLKGRTSELADIEFMRTAKINCGHARDEALAGGPITLGDKGREFEPGTDLCGLTSDTKTLQKRIMQHAYEGFFPRLFNLGTHFFNPKRYCAPPRQALKIWGEFTPKNAEWQHTQWEAAGEKGLPQEWVTSAFDEALRLMLRDGHPDEERSIILVSDGVDGYIRELDLCREHPPARCADLRKRRARNACVHDLINERVIKRQGQFKQKALHWIGAARAAGVRVFGVGLGMLGEDYELERLRLLAERTGGTYREAETEGALGARVQETASEIAGQLVVDFVHQEPEEAGDTLSLKLEARLDKTMVAGRTKLRSKAFTVPIPPRKRWQERLEDAVIDLLVSLQEAVGYKWYVVIGVAVIAIVSILVLLISFFVIRGIFRLIGRIFGGGEDSQ